MEVSRMLLQAEVHPEWKVWWAAVERWAREVWISRHRRPGGFPADALLEGELEWAWAITVGGGGPAPSEECPALAAIAAALDGLRLGWPEPATLKCLVSGQEWDLREGSPALLKKLLKARWTAGQRAKLTLWLQTRSTGIEGARAAGCEGAEDGFLGSLPGLRGHLDCDKVAELLMKPSVSLHARRVLLSCAAGVLPCGAWLARHGWDVEPRCSHCGELDDTRHCLLGCPAEAPDPVEAAAACALNWGKVAGPRRAWIGPEGSQAPEDGGLDSQGTTPRAPAVRCRIRGKQSKGSWQLLAPPVVEYKELYPPGVVVETVRASPSPLARSGSPGERGSTLTGQLITPARALPPLRAPSWRRSPESPSWRCR